MVSKSNQSSRNFKKASPSRIIPFRIPKSRRIIETQVIIEKVQKGDRTLFTVQPAIAEYIKTHIL